MAKLNRGAKKALAEQYKKAKLIGYWNDNFIDQGFVEKRKRQAKFREQVRKGERTQESAFLIPREIVRKSTVIYKRSRFRCVFHSKTAINSSLNQPVIPVQNRHP